VHISLDCAVENSSSSLLTIPRLRKEVLCLSMRDVFVWTDRTVVLSWLSGVGNCVSRIVNL
jgi:hypothetical protein